MAIKYYCMPEQGIELLSHDQILNFEEILRLCQIFADLGMKKIKLTGGEPLCRLKHPLPYIRFS